MPAPTFTPMTARRTAARTALVQRIVKPAARTKGAGVGVPRFAKPVQPAERARAIAKVAAPAAHRAPATSPATTPASPQLRPHHTPPKSAAPSAMHTASPNRHARWEQEATKLAARVQAGAPAKTNTKDAPSSTHSTTRTTPAHPGLGPSPPLAKTATQPLPTATRKALENSTGLDLGFVRVASSKTTKASAAAIGAKAYTQHGVIHLGPKANLSDTALLAHETAHVLQQTQPAHRLKPLGLSSAPQRVPLRFPADTTSDQREAAQNRLNIPTVVGDFIIPPTSAYLPASLVRTILWVGDEGLDLRLTRAVPNALAPTLEPFKKLQGWWQLGVTHARLFSERKARWEGILAKASRTDDPGVVNAAREIAHHLPGFLGVRWNDLRKMMEYSIAVANNGLAKWRQGLQSLAPQIAALFDSLGSGLTEAFREFNDSPETLEDLRLVLGFPSSCASAAAISDWAANMRRIADETILSLASPAENMIPSHVFISSLTDIENLNPEVRSLKTELTGIAEVMERREGFIVDRPKLARLLPTAHQRIASLNSSLAWTDEGLGIVFGGLCDGFGTFGRASALEYFPNEFDWISSSAVQIDSWARDQEPKSFALMNGSLTGVDKWSQLVAETLVEADTMDEEVTTYDSGWRRYFAPFWWLANSKDKIIEKLIKKVPFLRELVEEAAGLWRRAGGLFQRFKDRVFKEGRILAPLWEFFLGVIGLEVPAEFVSDVEQRGGSLLGKILKHPFRFLKNLAKGIGHGFQRFAKNIGTHLLNGVLQWLLGEFGMQPPATFGKIVHALMERIGFSRRTVSERIVEYLKKKGHTTSVATIDAKLEKAIKYGTTALRWLKLLFEGKYAEFWQELKGQLVKLWQWVIDKAVTYVVDQLKKKLLSWLVRFLDPTGIMAVLNTIKAIYDAIQTVIRYAQQMLEMAREVFRAVRQIANGEFEQAAGWVEQAAAKGLAVAIAFFARVVGLDSVVEYLKKGLSEVKKIVVAALDYIVAFAGEAWEWLVEKADQAKEWWKNRRRFNDTTGADREIFYQVGGGVARLHVTLPQQSGQLGTSSTPPTLHEYLIGFKPVTDREKAVHAELTRIATEINEIKEDSKGSFGTTDGEKIHALFNEAVLLLAELGGKAMPPATSVTWSTRSILGNNFPIKMVANPLSTDPGPYIGSKPVADGTKLWNKVRAHGATYIRGHLLNHHLHGSGTWENMIPIARTTNTKMEQIAESDVKKAVIGQNKVVQYEVEMTDFNKHKPKAVTPPENELPAKITMNAWELKYNRGKWDQKGPVILNNVELTNEVRTS